MVRILIVSWEYPPIVEGGLGRHVRKLAENLVQQGVEVHVLTRGARARRTKVSNSSSRSVTVGELRLCLSMPVQRRDRVVGLHPARDRVAITSRYGC